MLRADPLTALDPASAPVDGLLGRDRLAFVAQFSRLIRFYNLNNQIEGDWQPFLLKDAAILLATIAATDYQGLHAQYQALSHAEQLPPSAQQTMMPALLRLLQQLFATLAHWMHWLDWQEESFPLRAFLANSVRTQLAAALAHTRVLHQDLASRQLIEPPDLAWYRSLSPAWQARHHATAEAPSNTPLGNHQLLRQALKSLRQHYLDTLGVMIQTVDAAAAHYDTVASQTTPHPDSALLRVFVELMQYQQEKLNRIGPRHLDFYYQQVLQIEMQAAEPDQVMVLLTPAVGLPSVTLPAGIRFAAGKNTDGTPLYYANRDLCVINSARIAAAFSLKAQPDNAIPQGFAPGIHAGQLADLEKPQRNAAGHVQDQAAFGTPLDSPQSLGFALAGPMLLLEGGHRQIRLCCELADDTPLPETWAQGWHCWLTGDKGWFDAGAYALPPHWQPASDSQPAQLLLELILPAGAPQVVPASAPLDGRGCPWPQLKFSLPPIASAYPWPKINALSLDVQVRNLTTLQCWNPLAPLSLAAAAPLGPLPQNGSRFYLGSREIFAKPLDKLVLTLQWANLPASLSDWYHEYNQWQAALHPDWPSFDDNVHGGGWQWLQSDVWQDVSVNVPIGKSAAALFQGQGKSQFTFRVGPAQRPCPTLAHSPLPPPQTAHEGYLAFTLQTPPQAFGHQQYPQVLAWCSHQQAKHLMQPAQTGQDNPPGAPNPPFTPLLGGVSAEYSARCRLVPGADAGHPAPDCPLQWFHYGPWHNWLAWETGQAVPTAMPLAPGQPPAGLTLVPRVPTCGSLLLALADLPAPCTLRLYAGVSDDGNGAGFDAWQFGPDGWQPVEIWHDDSAGLSADGLLELSLSATPAPLPLEPALADCVWLALTPRDTWRPLRLALLASQAVILQRLDLPVDYPHTPRLAPDCIKKTPLPSLADVRQPLPSQVGRAAESRDGYLGVHNYYQRVSQRLLHKGRALTARDYILMAHQLMPTLYRVECLPCGPEARGEIRLGVVPRQRDIAQAGAFHPRLPPGQREHLATQLQACGSSKARVSVHNLAERQLTLAASLTLSDSAQAAWPSLREEWNLALRLYLSPWIDSRAPQYDLEKGLSRADLQRRLAGLPGVLAIEALSIALEDENGAAKPCDDDLLRAPPGRLWVSALQHQLTLAQG